MRKPDGRLGARRHAAGSPRRIARRSTTSSPHCETCPASSPREFACHRRIRYPIPEHVEEWLMARLPTTLACTAGALLVRGARRVRLGRRADREAARGRGHLLREPRRATACAGKRRDGNGSRCRRPAVPDDVHGRPARADALPDARAVHRRHPARHALHDLKDGAGRARALRRGAPRRSSPIPTSSSSRRSCARSRSPPASTCRS